MFVSGRAKLWYDHIRRLGLEGKGRLLFTLLLVLPQVLVLVLVLKIDEDKVK